MNDRPLPQNPEAESAVLGAILVDNDAIWKVPTLTPEQFAHEQNRKVYRAMLELAEDRTSITYLTLRDRCPDVPASFISALDQGILDSGGVRHHAELIREAARRRTVIIQASELVKKAWSEDPSDLMRELSGMADRFLAESHADTVTGSQMARAEMARVEERVDRNARGEEGFDGVPTGIRTLDAYIMGWDSALFVVGGRPSTGKSLLTLRSALEIARRGEAVFYLGLDMPQKFYEGRLVWMLAHDIEPGFCQRWEYRKGQLSDEQLEVITRAASELARLPIRLNATRRNLQMIVAELRRAKRDWGARVAFIDHFGKIDSDLSRDAVRRAEAEADRLSSFAADEDLPVVLLSQMARGSAKAGPPTLDELRRTGKLEENARTVLLIDAPSDRDETIPKCRLDVIIAKQGEDEKGFALPLHANLDHQRVEGDSDRRGRCRFCNSRANTEQKREQMQGSFV